MRRAAFLVIALALAACGRGVDLMAQAPATLAEEPAGRELAEVVRAVDGDTLVVRITGLEPGAGVGAAVVGRSYRVRLIGIDTPESVAPGRPVECFGEEAAGAAAALLEGESVTLVKDAEETDGYDRLLRYVYLGAEMVNARLVVNGYARALEYPPNVRHSSLFADLQRAARGEDRGLWSEDTCAGVR